jgi:hypothetical protein
MSTFGSNEHLRGHMTQKRCGLCERHPILFDGRCLDCGAVSPPLFRRDAQPCEQEVPAERPPRPALEAPRFSEWMRKPMPRTAADMRGEGLVGSSVHPGAYVLQDTFAANSRTAAPPPMHNEDAPAGTVTTARGEEPSAKRRQADGRASTARTTRKRSAPESDKIFTLTELCNEAALEDLASRRRAATWHPRSQKGTPHGPTLRRIISDFLEQVRDGALTTVFREEERMVALGLRGRRHTGYKRSDDIHSFEKLIASGVNPGSVARSFFSLPNCLQDFARAGLRDCYVLGMANAHPYIQHRRSRSL